jgi:hypothetical protein
MGQELGVVLREGERPLGEALPFYAYAVEPFAIQRSHVRGEFFYRAA